MGKRLFGFTKGETTYSFRIFPIGGYCAMEGEDEVGGNPSSTKKRRRRGEPEDPSGDAPEDIPGDTRKDKSDNSPEDIADGEAPADTAKKADGTDPAEQTDTDLDIEPEEEDGPTDSLSDVSSDPHSFNNAKIWKRMIIIIAGAVMNILLGIVLMFITQVTKDSYASTQVSVFSPISWSSVTGLKQGDKIVNINGYDVNTSTDFSFALYTLPVTQVDSGELSVYKEDCAYDLYDYARSSMTEATTQETNTKLSNMLRTAQTELCDAADKEAAYKIFCRYYSEISKELGIEVKEYPVIEQFENRMRYRTDMTVIRDGERIVLHDVDFLTTKPSADGDPQINIDFYVQPIEKNFGTVISQTFSETISNIRMVWGSLAGLVTGKFSLNDMSGPIGIASAISTVASESLETSGFGGAVMSIIYVMMIITINLGIINMLPFPALDGGRFILLLIEAIFKKRVPIKVERIINAVGLVLLLGLSAVIAVKDIIMIFVGG